MIKNEKKYLTAIKILFFVSFVLYISFVGVYFDNIPDLETEKTEKQEQKEKSKDEKEKTDLSDDLEDIDDDLNYYYNILNILMGVGIALLIISSILLTLFYQKYPY